MRLASTSIKSGVQPAASHSTARQSTPANSGGTLNASLKPRAFQKACVKAFDPSVNFEVARAPPILSFLASGIWALTSPLSGGLSGGLTPPLTFGLPPRFPFSLSSIALASSRRIRRENIVPSSSRLKTPFISSSMSSAEHSRSGTPIRDANCFLSRRFPLTSKEPYGVASCIRHIISAQRPRAASEHKRSMGSDRQSEG